MGELRREGAGDLDAGEWLFMCCGESHFDIIECGGELDSGEDLCFVCFGDSDLDVIEPVPPPERQAPQQTSAPVHPLRQASAPTPTQTPCISGAHGAASALSVASQGLPKLFELRP